MPDNYYIIVDGYGRKDALEDLYGFESSHFAEMLDEKGFSVASQVSSN